MEGIDPDFIAALPPDIQAEVMEQQRRDRRRRRAAREAEAAQVCFRISRWSLGPQRSCSPEIED